MRMSTSRKIRLIPAVAPPTLNNGNLPQISHVEFCYDYELTATKTATAQFKRNFSRTIRQACLPSYTQRLCGSVI